MSEEKEPTKALATRSTIAVGSAGLAIKTFEDLQRFCQAAVASGYFKGTEELAQAIVKVQYGMELGLPPVTAMQAVYIVEGKPSLSAGAIAARIKTSGVYTYRVQEMTAQVCVLEFFERGQSVGLSSFSMEDAKAAGVTDKSVWKRYARNMMFSRALSNGARWYCPDIFMGAVYTPEELGGLEAEVIEVPRQPAPAPQSRAPQAPTTSRPGHVGPPPALSAPAGASDSEPPPHDDADAGPPEDSETPWEHARNAAAVKAAEAELGAKVAGVSPPPKPPGFWAQMTAFGFRSKAEVEVLLEAQFGTRDPARLDAEQKAQAKALLESEAKRKRASAVAVVREARGGAR